MSSFHGSTIPMEFRRSPPSPLPSSLSPLAAPFTAGNRSLSSSDPIHNPPSLGPTAPTMLQSSQHQRSIQADAFAFASGGERTGGAGAAPYYEPYEQWKPSWVPDVGTDVSASWIDPSQSYPVSPMDKGSAPSTTLKHYDQTQIAPSGPHTNPLPNTYHIVPEASHWKRAEDPSFYMTGPLSSKSSRSSGMGPTLKEASMEHLPNASRPSDVGPSDPFSNGFRSSVVAPMLKELSDSFSLDATSSKGYRGLPYDKYMTSSALSPTDSSPFGPGSGLGVPTDPLANHMNGFSSMHYGNPCRISFDSFDYFPQEQKNPVAHSTPGHTKVTIASPVAKPPTLKRDNQVVAPPKLEVKCKSGNAQPEDPGIGFDMDSTVLEALDEHNIVLDSPCWKGMPPSSQYTFSRRHTGNSCNAHALLENEVHTGNLLPSETSQDKKLDTVTIGLVSSSEEKPKDVKTNQNLEPENVEDNVSSATNVKDEKGKGSVSAIASDIAGPQADVKVLIKSMHDLSQVLLTSCDDNFELKDHELELLQIAMENLKSFSGRRNKTDDGGSASRTKISEQVNAGMDNRSSNEAKDNQINVGTKLDDVNYKKSVLEALDKIPVDESEVQAELYKNLWIEAEVSLCTMKYELQLARTKLKMESQKRAQEANTSCSFWGPKPSDTIQEVGTTTLPKQTSINLYCDMSDEKNTGRPVADPAVMARLRIIKGRMDNMASEDQSNHEKNLEENIMVQNKDVSSLTSSRDEVLHDEVDNDVMARLRILKRRGDVGLNLESVLPNYCSLGFGTEPHDLQPHSGSSEWEHVLRDELFPSGNSPLNGKLG